MADEVVSTNAGTAEQATVETTQETVVEAPQENGNDELLKLKAEIAKQKAAIDKATKEAAEYKRALRSKQTEDEIAAEEKRIADEAKDQRLAELEKMFAVSELSKLVMPFGGDEAVTSRIAEMLHGADDAKTALAEIGKLFTAREKALRLEFGKIPPPGVGGTEQTPETLAVNRARNIGKAKAEADKTASEAMKAYMR